MKRIFSSRKYKAVVRLLDGEEFTTEVTKNTPGREILDQVCKHVELDEIDFFGLKYVCSKDKQLNWIDNMKSIGKQMGNGPYHLLFHVKFYPPNPGAVREDITRYQLVLQLRDDLLKERLICSIPIHALLASYLIQAEMGDYCLTEHTKDYIDGLQFMPNQTDDFLLKVHEFHKKHKGLSPADAEYHYLDNARKIPLYGMDLHDALDGDDTSVILGVSETGIHVILKGREISKFSWSNIHKVYFKSKRFYLDIRVVTEVEYEDLIVGFRCRTRTELKRLYRSAIDHHTFFRRDASILGSQKVAFFRIGSRFRYSGRKTFQQLKKTSQTRPPPTFQRVSSQRLAKSSSSEKNAKETSSNQKGGKDDANITHVDENTANQEDASPSISRECVIMPTEDQQTPTEKLDSKANKNAHNNLAVTITISPPTPVPGDRRLIGSEDNPDDCIADARESYDVIDLYEEEETATSQEAVQSQQASTVVVEKQDSNDGENVPPGAEDGSKTVVSATQIESTTFKSSGETTTRVTSSTTTTSKIITQTEVITVNESNEEIIVVEEEHIKKDTAAVEQK